MHSIFLIFPIKMKKIPSVAFLQHIYDLLINLGNIWLLLYKFSKNYHYD